MEFSDIPTQAWKYHELRFFTKKDERATSHPVENPIKPTCEILQSAPDLPLLHLLVFVVPELSLKPVQLISSKPFAFDSSYPQLV